MPAAAARPFSGEIPVERRFPLHLEPSIGSIRDLYDSAKQAHWDPERDIPWGLFDPSRYRPQTLAAARLSAQAELATDYFALRAQDQLQKLLDDTVDAETQSLKIAENRYHFGVAARADVVSAQAGKAPVAEAFHRRSAEPDSAGCRAVERGHEMQQRGLP